MAPVEQFSMIEFAIGMSPVVIALAGIAWGDIAFKRSRHARRAVINLRHVINPEATLRRLENRPAGHRARQRVANAELANR